MVKRPNQKKFLLPFVDHRKYIYFFTYGFSKMVWGCELFSEDTAFLRSGIRPLLWMSKLLSNFFFWGYELLSGDIKFCMGIRKKLNSEDTSFVSGQKRLSGGTNVCVGVRTFVWEYTPISGVTNFCLGVRPLLWGYKLLCRYTSFFSEDTSFF